MKSKCRQTNRDAQRAIPSRIVDTPWRRCFFQSLSIKELALNSDFKVINVVINGRWLWWERGSRKAQYRLYPRRNPKCSRSRSSRSEEECAARSEPGTWARGLSVLYLLRELANHAHRSIIAFFQGKSRKRSYGPAVRARLGKVARAPAPASIR